MIKTIITQLKDTDFRDYTKYNFSPKVCKKGGYVVKLVIPKEMNTLGRWPSNIIQEHLL